MSAKILYVDDERDILELAQAFLTDEGLELDIAWKIPEAQRLIRTGHYEVIISDLRMPEMDGGRLLGWARSEAQFRGKAILVTGSAGDLRDRSAFDVILQKPLDFDELIAKVKALL